MRIAVVGAGAWGLPAAAEAARRGHDVLLLDRFGTRNPYGSSIGPTRLWRLADPDPLTARLARRAIAAMQRLERTVGEPVHRRLGLLWRDRASLDRLARALAAEGIAYERVAAADVATRVPGLRSDGRDAFWFPDAGIVLADRMLAAQERSLRSAGGQVRTASVIDVGSDAGGARLVLEAAPDVRADVVVLAPGTGAGALLSALDIPVPLRPYAEQVVHFGRRDDPHALDELPCLFDGPEASEPGIYCMPSPGIGYKIGLDTPLRPLADGDLTRVPDPARTEAITRRVRRDLRSVPPTVLDEQVCTWTDSPDGRFVIDRVGNVVLACGDSGEGFKFSALVGEVLADLAEGRDPDDDIRALGLHRFAGRELAQTWTPTTLGSHGEPAG